MLNLYPLRLVGTMSNWARLANKVKDVRFCSMSDSLLSGVNIMSFSRVISLATRHAHTQLGLAQCQANDYGFDSLPHQYLFGFGKYPGLKLLNLVI